MWAEVNGERKKVACGPCIRGHRSSKCDHRDRVLVEVRKPGRPLSSCPHPTGSCSCERVVINYTIPKTSECACPSERAPSVAPSHSGRVQKSRTRKATSTFSPAVLEKAIQASQDGETDSSSLLTRTPTSEVNSPPSSASSTPRLLPLRKESQSLENPVASSSGPPSRPTTSQAQAVSSCCQPKSIQPAQPPPQAGSCCSKKTPELPKPAQPAKSCCGGSKPAPLQYTPQNHQMNGFGAYPQYPAQFQPQHYEMLNQNHFVPMAPPPNFTTPIYNHVGSTYHPPPPSIPMTPMGAHAGTHATNHNCHCGDGCSCFGCAAHPNNATMMEYIRSMHQWMSTGQFGAGPPPTYDMPTYPHHQVRYGAQAGPPYNTTAANFMPPNQLSFQNSNPMNMTSPAMNVASPWPQSSVSTPVQAPPSMDSQFFATSNASTPTGLPEPTLTLKVEEVQSPISVDSPSEGKDDDTATLSPSTFFWQEVVLPGCNDATGTCQCGDGCECVGCLTHGGHNGVLLDMPTGPDEQNAFPDFLSTNDLNTHGPNQFMTFSPT
ncbi:hypothetical protein P280DRAFT_487911 [Massarina eburnea CBS 473.64]|uniref:Copper-fist domain-containing protein n=1 Tax=Massarina eburnea CBS 473.64 TaxID=1395130 RepID=A0A6A6S870_9PLEO|nr:hypothetical protein P280DRAFT_487911 [Massarina eburnea CBS 473.64]